MDDIRALWEVTVDPPGVARFGIKDEICAAADLEPKVDVPDLTTTYDPRRNCWTAAGKWAEGKELCHETQDSCTKKNSSDGLMQRNKKKVWPVMDFRELNMHIDAFTANSDMCADNLRVWRGKGKNVSVVD